MKIVFTPDWFIGKDVMIDLFSFFVLLALFILSVQSYRLSKKKNCLYLGSGFFLISLAQLANILTKAVLYYDTSVTQTIGQAVVTYNVVKSVDIFYYAGFFFNKLFTLIGLFILYKLPAKKVSKDFLLIFYLLLVSTLLPQSLYFIFHLTALIFLLAIIRNYSFIYQKNKNKNTGLLTLGFIILALSNLLMLFSKINTIFVISELTALASYCVFLVVVVKIFRASKSINAQKK